MKKSLVLDLQELATDSTRDITDLLRMALIVATKLRLDDFRKWVECELHGYGDKSVPIPQYRNVRAEMKVHNPFHGLQPFILPTQLERMLCNITYGASISSVASTLEMYTDGHSLMPPTFPLEPEERAYLLNGMRVPLEPVRVVSLTSLRSMIDAVRSTVLDWALRLESQGILGENMTFTKEEKARASATQVNIGNFQGILGDVSHSDVRLNLKMSIRPGDIAALKRSLASAGVPEADLSDLSAALASEPKADAGTMGPMVSGWVGRMVQKAAMGTWDISTGAAAQLLAELIAKYYGWH